MSRPAVIWRKVQRARRGLRDLSRGTVTWQANRGRCRAGNVSVNTCSLGVPDTHKTGALDFTACREPRPWPFDKRTSATRRRRESARPTAFVGPLPCFLRYRYLGTRGTCRPSLCSYGPGAIKCAIFTSHSSRPRKLYPPPVRRGPSSRMGDLSVVNTGREDTRVPGLNFLVVSRVLDIRVWHLRGWNGMVLVSGGAFCG